MENTMKQICELNDKIILGQEGLSKKAPRITARAIVKNQDGLYAVMYADKFKLHSLPAGGVDDGEDVLTALRREVYEETSVKLEIDRLGYVHENYFICDSPEKLGKLIYEICFYYFMKVPEEFSLIQHTFKDGGDEEYLQWISMDTEKKIYPEFLKEELSHPSKEIKHIVTDERKG